MRSKRRLSVKRRYLCPETGELETAKIDHGADFLKSSPSAKADLIEIPKQSRVADCTGLGRCPVKDSRLPDASVHWERCPLNAMMKRGAEEMG